MQQETKPSIVRVPAHTGADLAENTRYFKHIGKSFVEDLGGDEYQAHIEIPVVVPARVLHERLVLCFQLFYAWDFNAWFLGGPEIVDFGGLGGPGGPKNHSRRLGYTWIKSIIRHTRGTVNR